MKMGIIVGLLAISIPNSVIAEAEIKEVITVQDSSQAVDDENNKQRVPLEILQHSVEIKKENEPSPRARLSRDAGRSKTNDLTNSSVIYRSRSGGSAGVHALKQQF